MTVQDLIALLKTKDKKAEVEFIICTKAGAVIAMDIESDAHDIATLLKAFGKK